VVVGFPPLPREGTKCAFHDSAMPVTNAAASETLSRHEALLTHQAFPLGRIARCEVGLLSGDLVGTTNQLDAQQYKQRAEHGENELLLRRDRKGAEHRAERERAGVPDEKRVRRRPEPQETQTCADQCGA
jgi:hypothetical protein